MGGVSFARNVGLDNARGEWITFSDSDDELLPDAFEVAHSYMHDGVDMVRTGYVKVDEHGNVVETHQCEEPLIIDNREEMMGQCDKYIYHGFLWDTFVKRSTVGDIRFDTNISWCEDHIFTFTVMSEVHKLALVPTCTYRYFIYSFRNDNLSVCYHDPSEILRAAKVSKEVEYKLIGSSKELKQIVDGNYEGKIKHVAVETFQLDGIMKTISFVFKESTHPLGCFIYLFKQYLKSFKLFKLLMKRK